MLRNILLLLVMLTCLVSGYFIGDYRGKQAREALQNVTSTGKLVDAELRVTNTRLKSELDGIHARYSRDIDQLKAEYGESSLNWQRSKEALDRTIRLQNSRLAELNRALAELITDLGRTTGSDKVQMEQKVAILRQDIDALMRDMKGDSCLRVPAPVSAIDMLNGTHREGDNR